MDEIEKMLAADAAREPEPHELASSFDAGTWAAVRSLIKVLRNAGVLDVQRFGELCEEMLKVEQQHRDRGETQRAEDVHLAAKMVALITEDPV